MKNIVKIAFRNINRQKKRTFLLGGAIAFGILIITVLNGFTGGLADNIKENFSAIFGGQIFITGSEITDSGRIVSVIRNDKIIDEAVKPVKDEIKSAHKHSRALAEVIFGSKTDRQRIDGIDWNVEKDFASSLPIVEGSVKDLSNPKVIILPVSTAKRLGVEIGESILVRLSTITGQQNVGDFILAATVRDQESMGISTGYANIDYLNSLLGMTPGEFQVYNIYLKSMENMDSVGDAIYAGLKKRAATEERLVTTPTANDNSDAADSARQKNMRRSFASLMGSSFFNAKNIEPWEGTKYSLITLNDMMGEVTAMVQVINTIGLGIFVLLLIITMVGVTNSFRMTILERVREIGTMRAIGMQRNSVRNIFLLEAFFTALAGAIAGLIAAGVVMFIVSRVTFSSSSFMWFFLRNGRMTFTVLPVNVLVNLVILSLLSLLAAWNPAKKASKMEAAQALRTEY
ncbi:MAG: FtsX-like permease family protein [Spirochaetales bacterium]|nr:FtsX-like permease family protein [Spirochaetales bacterium]